MEYANYSPKNYKPLIKGPSLEAQYLPSSREYDSFMQREGLYDPIGDSSRWSSPQLIHRYKNRVLFLPTSRCPITCRFCFRKNEINAKDDIFKEDFQKTLGYLKKHREINEVIFTGGDPLILSTKKIAYFLERFGEVEHIQFIRFHTRTPLVLPERIDDKLVHLLEEFKNRFNITFVIHCNHNDELFPHVIKGIKKLSPFRLLSQSVLLKGVNDNAKTLKNLFESLSRIGVTPYYLHHPDKVKGAMHFYLDKETGLKIYKELKKEVSGWMLPRYVIDGPKAIGKELVLESI